MLVDEADDRARKEDQTYRGRNRQQRRQAQPFAQHRPELPPFPSSRAPRNQRERHGANGNPEQPQRQLHEPERTVQP